MSWCTQCYADLRPAAVPEPELRAPTVPAPAAAQDGRLDPLTAPAIALGLPPTVPLAAVWPCLTCGAPNPLSESECSTCGAGFLAGLRASGTPHVTVPGVGDLASLPRNRRLGLAAAVVLALGLIGALLGMLLS